MKFSAVALAVAFAATAQSFSVTMSSIGYLDKLASGSAQSLSSFASSSSSGSSNGAPAPSWSGSTYAPPSPMPYSPPSYGGSSAPAPSSSYRSLHADVPANNDLHYLKTLGGGNSMKGGRNFAGVSSSFRVVRSGSNYLDALFGKQMAPASYATGSSSPQGYGASAPTPSYSYGGSAPSPSYAAPSNSYAAPAPANGSYLDNIGGSSYGGSSSSYGGGSSYSGVNPRPRKVVAAFGSYLDTL